MRRPTSTRRGGRMKLRTLIAALAAGLLCLGPASALAANANDNHDAYSWHVGVPFVPGFPAFARAAGPTGTHQAHSRERNELPADRGRGDALHQVVAAERTLEVRRREGAGSAAPRVGGWPSRNGEALPGSVAMLEHDLRLSRRRFVQLAGAG